MAQRLDLEAIFRSFTPNVYFQPPPSVMMVYPCIVYEISKRRTLHADNQPYRMEKGYQVTVISRDPDDVLPDHISKLGKTRFLTAFKKNNLNHEVFELYF